jgi:NADH-quinone oxidoreductase subunit M
VLVLLAALIRMGVFPLHAWVPFIIERGPMPLVLVGIVTPIGSFLIARVGLPLFPDQVGVSTLLPLGVLTAIYGALLAVGQHDLRRMLGFILVSQSGFVLTGIASLNEQSVAGSLLQAMATVVACSGLLLVASAVEARAGTVDMRRLGGLVRRAPRMASVFLLLSFAAVGFPGTVTFVSEDLLVQGLLRSHGLLAGTLLLVTAVNGVTLIRAFKRTFLGPASRHADDLGSFEDVLPRERWVSMTIVVALLAGGFAAAPLLAVRQGVLGIMPRSAQAPAGPGAPRW